MMGSPTYLCSSRVEWYHGYKGFSEMWRGMLKEEVRCWSISFCGTFVVTSIIDMTIVQRDCVVCGGPGYSTLLML